MPNQIVDSCNASSDSCPNVHWDAYHFEANYPRNNGDSYFDQIIEKIESVLVAKPEGGGAIIHTDTELKALKSKAPNPLYAWDNDA